MTSAFRLLVLCCFPLSLHAQSTVLPLFECQDILTRSGSTVLAQDAAAGDSTIVVAQPIPLGSRAVLNPGASNEEVISMLDGSGTGPYTYRLYAGWASSSTRTVTQSHTSGEPIVFETRTGSGYYSYQNLSSDEVSFAPGGATNFVIPGNPNLGQPSTFARGLQRFNFALPYSPLQSQSWILGSLIAVAAEFPETRCGYTPPIVQAESLPLALGTTRTNVRLGTVSASYPTTFTASVQFVSVQTASRNGPIVRSSDVSVSNLRVENGAIFGDIAANAGAMGRMYTYALRATTSTGQSGIGTGTIEATSACPLTVTPSALPTAFVNTPYTATLQATGATAPYRFRLETNALPLGLTLSEAGVLSGTPQQTGTFPLTFTTSSINGCFHRTSMDLEIQGQFCAANITPQVQITLGGFRQNLVTRRWQQTVTLRNNTQSSIFGPVALVLDNLSANATALNPAGTTTCAEPFGRPFFLAPIGNTNFFAAGSSVSLNLEFTTTTNGAITYTPRVIAGGAIR
jgi:hypothetical protein